MSGEHETLEVAAKALQHINKYGFRSKKNATDLNPSTAHMIINDDFSKLSYKGVGEFVRWIETLETQDTFLQKGKVAFQKYYMSDWEIPFAVIAVNKYLNEKKMENEYEIFKNSEHIGKIGDRKDFFLKLYRTRKLDTSSGVFILHNFHDRDYNLYTIIKPNRIEDIEIGDCVLIRATVKKHNNYNGSKQTNLNRPKFKWNAGKKESGNDS